MLFGKMMTICCEQMVQDLRISHWGHLHFFYKINIYDNHNYTIIMVKILIILLLLLLMMMMMNLSLSLVITYTRKLSKNSTEEFPTYTNISSYWCDTDYPITCTQNPPFCAQLTNKIHLQTSLWLGLQKCKKEFLKEMYHAVHQEISIRQLLPLWFRFNNIAQGKSYNFSSVSEASLKIWGTEAQEFTGSGWYNHTITTYIETDNWIRQWHAHVQQHRYCIYITTPGTLPWGLNGNNLYKKLLLFLMITRLLKRRTIFTKSGVYYDIGYRSKSRISPESHDILFVHSMHFSRQIVSSVCIKNDSDIVVLCASSWTNLSTEE